MVRGVSKTDERSKFHVLELTLDGIFQTVYRNLFKF